MTTLRVVRPASRREWFAFSWHSATFAAATVGLIWRLYLSAIGYDDVAGPDGTDPTAFTRIVRYFSFFTIESNIFVAVTIAALVLNIRHDGPLWRIVRVAGLYGIAVTGVIYALLLRDTSDLHGQAIITNALLHYWVPPMAVLGWLLFGPWPRIDKRTLRLSLIWPAVYVVYTLIHGAISKWYPYPFVNVNTHGYPRTIINGALIMVFLILLGLAMMWLDRRLTPSPQQEQV
jgi:hypothetical protein